jgi:hypothetical protein
MKDKKSDLETRKPHAKKLIARLNLEMRRKNS